MPPSQHPRPASQSSSTEVLHRRRGAVRQHQQQQSRRDLSTVSDHPAAEPPSAGLYASQRRSSGGHRNSLDRTSSSARIGEYEDASYWVKLVLFIGAAKLFIEASLRASQFLEVAVIGRFSYTGRLIMYGAEILTYYFIPILYRWFELHSQAKYLLFIGGFGTVTYVYYMTDSYGPPAWGSGGIACYIIALTVVGVIYPLSSIGAIALVGRSAYYRVHDPTTKEDGILRRPSILTSEGGQRMNDDSENPLGRNLARFYGIYIGSYAGAGVLLIILGLLLLQLPKQLDLGEYKGLAFWSLGMLSLVGTFLYLGIPPCPRSDVIPGSPVPCVSPWRTFIFPIAHRRFRVYALLLVVCGMVEAYGYVDFVMYISTPRIGPRASSLVTGFALFIDGLVAFMYGWLVYRGFCTLRTVVLLGAIALVLAMAYCAALSAAVMVSSGVGEGGGKNSSSILGLNYTRVSDGPEKWIEIDDVEVYDYFVVASCIILIALGLLPYKAHLSSVTQQIYQPTPYHLQVSAHLKGLRSLGFMVQMGFDNLISSYYGISQTSNLIAALVLLVLTILTYLPLGISWIRDSRSRQEVEGQRVSAQTLTHDTQ